MGRTACTEPQCLYNGALYLYLIKKVSSVPRKRNYTPLRHFNRLTPNDPYMGRTAPLTSKHSILHIYSTNIGTEYFKHALYSPFFSLQNAVCFIMLICLVSVLHFIYRCAKITKKKKIRRQKVKK